MKMKKKLVFIGGARPNFMKIAPIIRQTAKLKKFKNIIIHTGQHYDDNMSKVFFEDLAIPKPGYFLKTGSGTHASQTAKIMLSLEKIFKQELPDLVIVVGDVNSTMAAAITAKKLGIKTAHVEAGLRSFDMTMPEEINRIVTDSISDMFFVTERSAVKNLLKEGKRRDSIYFTGNVMIDSLFYALKKLKTRRAHFGTTDLKNKLRKYIYLTLHRPSNVDNKEALLNICGILGKAGKIYPIIFPVHPRTKNRLEKFKIKLSPDIHVIPPLSYTESLFIWKDAEAVITDSGGLQEETTALRKPCFTLRNNTERPVTVTCGTNILLNAANRHKLPAMLTGIKTGSYKHGRIPPKWDGNSSKQIVKILRSTI